VSPVWQRLTVLSVLACATIFVGGFAWQVVGAVAPVLGLFFGGWLIACVLEPLVRWFTLRTRAPRSLAIVTAYVVIVVALAVAAIGATPWLAEQMDATVAGMPATVQSALARTLVEQSAANAWLASHGIALQIDVGSLATLENRRLEPLLDTSTSMALTALGDGLSAFGKLGIMLLLSVFFLVGGTDLSHRLARLAGDRVEDDVRFVFTAVHDTFDSFLRAQLVQCVLFAAGVWMCLAVAHVSAAPLVGLVAGALLLVPVVGGVS